MKKKKKIISKGLLSRYAGGVWKRSFIPSIWPTVHTNPSRKPSFPKTLPEPENFETPVSYFRVDARHFETSLT